MTMAMDTALAEARRQLQICNACRYCEGYCSAFPAITRQRAFADGDIAQIANLCHNCRGCHYACQYTEPHEFALNLPKALAEVRVDSWERHAWPGGLARAFLRHGCATVGAIVAGFAVLFLAIRALGAAGGGAAAPGEGFYAVLSHSAMVALFAPAFLLPFGAMAFGLRGYWREVGGGRIRWRHLRDAVASAATMRNLSGGHGEGCNFEKEERFSSARRWAHQAILYGFLLCFASTSSGTILHYAFDMPAPYPLWSIPKLLGIPGGILLTIGCAWMLHLRSRAEPHLSDAGARGAGAAFTALLGFTGLSGLALYALGDSAAMPALLAVHLGAVLAFFVLIPYSRMAHGFYRLAALVRDAQARGI